MYPQSICMWQQIWSLSNSQKHEVPSQTKHTNDKFRLHKIWPFWNCSSTICRLHSAAEWWWIWSSAADSFNWISSLCWAISRAWPCRDSTCWLALILTDNSNKNLVQYYRNLLAEYPFGIIWQMTVVRKMEVLKITMKILKIFLHKYRIINQDLGFKAEYLVFFMTYNHVTMLQNG